MPYIEQHRREKLAVFVRCIDELNELSEGELNYLITKLCDKHIGAVITYAGVNAVVGVLECAKLELYRRLAGPYEDKKREAHGDVYRIEVSKPSQT